MDDLLDAIAEVFGTIWEILVTLVKLGLTIALMVVFYKVMQWKWLHGVIVRVENSLGVGGCFLLVVIGMIIAWIFVTWINIKNRPTRY